MKMIFIIMLISLLLFSGCSSGGSLTAQQTESVVSQSAGDVISDDMRSTINDWILGMDYGIKSIGFDGSTFTVFMSDDKKAELADYELADIRQALADIGEAYGYASCEMEFADGSVVASSDRTDSSEKSDNSDDAANALPANGETINLIFIHHSVGENWLSDALNEMLNDNNIHVADTYYGWSDMGVNTDIQDWPNWLNDRVMPSVYSKMDTETAHNTIPPGEGKNTIIMFKSCFPNSDVGMGIEDEKAIYNSLLDYFARHPDKMFVLITSPPMQQISFPKKTRELANFLVSKDGWLKDYSGNNVFVFDLYNVLTAPENHHMLVDGQETHIVASAYNTLYYDSDGDDHPNSEGNVKAADEFVPLLLYWYDIFTMQTH